MEAFKALASINASSKSVVFGVLPRNATRACAAKETAKQNNKIAGHCAQATLAQTQSEWNFSRTTQKTGLKNNEKNIIKGRDNDLDHFLGFFSFHLRTLPGKEQDKF